MVRKKGKKSAKQKEEQTAAVEPEKEVETIVHDEVSDRLFPVYQHPQTSQSVNGDCKEQENEELHKKRHKHLGQQTQYLSSQLLDDSSLDNGSAPACDYDRGTEEAEYEPLPQTQVPAHEFLVVQDSASHAFNAWAQTRMSLDTPPFEINDYERRVFPEHNYVYAPGQHPVGIYPRPSQIYPDWEQRRLLTDTAPPEISDFRVGEVELQQYALIAQQQTLHPLVHHPPHASAAWRQITAPIGADSPRTAEYGNGALIPQPPFMVHNHPQQFSVWGQRTIGYGPRMLLPHPKVAALPQNLEIQQHRVQSFPAWEQRPEDYVHEQPIEDNQLSPEPLPALIQENVNSQPLSEVEEDRISSLRQDNFDSQSVSSPLVQSDRHPNISDVEITNSSHLSEENCSIIQGVISNTTTVAAVAKELSALNIQPKRNKKKTESNVRRITVETNYLALDLSKIRNNILIHYDVALEPFGPKRLLRNAMEIFREIYYPERYPAFDGKKNLYSSGFLPFGRELQAEVEVHDEETCSEKLFKITIKYASQVDLHALMKYMTNRTSSMPPQDIIQAIDIVLRNAAAFRFVPVGRCFFTPPKNQILELGSGLEMWYGFFQSAIMGWKPFINIDIVHKGFPRSVNVVDIILDVCNNIKPEDLHNELSVSHKTDLTTFIRGLKIDYMLPDNPSSKRTYKVNNIAQSAAEQEFELENGMFITVQEYFTYHKKLKLKYPNLPCLNVGAPNRTRPIYVPAELCTVSKGQVTIKKINEKQATKLIRQAATSTEDRKRKILETLKRVGLQKDPCLKEFGLSINDQFEKVEAKVLEAPQLEYKPVANKRTIVQPMKGVWKASSFMSCNKLTNWVILNLDQKITEEDLKYFVKELQFRGKNLGMEIAQPLNPHNIHLEARNLHKLESFFSSMKNRVQLVFVVVPDKGDCYAKVKRMAELNVGVLTQCLKARTVLRMKGSTCSNILLKVNSKLNGINHTLAAVSRPPCLRRPVMIVGADVTHPSQDQIDIPSVAAVSASHDPKAFQYNIQVRLQTPKTEIIEDLEAIMKQQLLFFYRRTSYKPERIIFFRDGVSEGQFPQVLNNEVKAIRSACSSLNQEYKPKVTFMVVQKRHHTRFFPRVEDSEDDYINVPPGTVVDTDITHPSEMDFFLVSHASIQGVSRPTKYRLLWNDDESLMEDEIEQITYYLCHMFSRCTRSVSYPAPTYYAHLAAYRARVYLEGEKIKLSDLSSEQKKYTVQKEIIVDHPMFFV